MQVSEFFLKFWFLELNTAREIWKERRAKDNIAPTDGRPREERLPAYISNRDYHDIFVYSERQRQEFSFAGYKIQVVQLVRRRDSLVCTCHVPWCARKMPLLFGGRFCSGDTAKCDQVTDVQWNIGPVWFSVLGSTRKLWPLITVLNKVNLQN